jgi:RNA 2',3'-cyclic 3'-phosphodiesterase
VSRLFVGLWPPVEVLDELEALLREDRPGVRWTTRAQWHVTLRFLGSADPVAAADALAGLRHPPVDVVVGGPVGRLGRGVLMVPVGGLDSLADAVAQAFAGIGKADDNGRAFLGHLTLARLRGTPACGLIGVTVAARWRATEVCLVESIARPGGSVYRTLATSPLT